MRSCYVYMCIIGMGYVIKEINLYAVDLDIFGVSLVFEVTNGVRIRLIYRRCGFHRPERIA